MNIKKIISIIFIIMVVTLVTACSETNTYLESITVSNNVLVAKYTDKQTKTIDDFDQIKDIIVNDSEEVIIKYESLSDINLGKTNKKHLIKFTTSNNQLIDVYLVKADSTIKKPLDPVKEGYVFKGWYSEGDFYTFNSLVSKHLTLVSHFDFEGSIIYDSINLNNTKKPTFEPNKVTNEINNYQFQYSRVKESNNHVNLEHTGILTNVSPIHKIKGIKVVFNKLTNNAKLNLYYGNNALPIFNNVSLVSDTYIDLDASYFVIQALDKRFTLDDFDIAGHANEFNLKQEANSVIEILSIEIYYEEVAINDLDNLPKIYIETALDSSNNHLPILNKEDYVDSKIIITDPTNAENDLGGEEGLDAGIRLRGNSTRTRPKKPYKIKFDKKQSLFGLTAAKDWALLADYMDGSALHNYTALSLGQNLDSFSYSPSSIFIELYLNGKYQGLYLLTEHQEAKEGRIEIDQKLDKVLDLDAVDYSVLNFFIEFDRSVIHYPDSEIEGEDYFKIVIDPNEQYGTYYFSIKYPDKKDFTKAFGQSEETDALFTGFFNYVKDYTENLLVLFSEENSKNEFKNHIDHHSLVDFLMIDFIMIETDHKFQSLKMHYIAEDEKLYYGPIWDYDSMVMGLKFEKYPVNYPFDKGYDKRYVLPHLRKTIHNHFFYDYVNRFDGLEDLKQRYQEVGKDLITDVLFDIKYNALPLISETLIKDANLWYKGDLSIVFENLLYTYNYLELRQEFLNSYLK